MKFDRANHRAREKVPREVVVEQDRDELAKHAEGTDKYWVSLQYLVFYSRPEPSPDSRNIFSKVVTLGSRLLLSITLCQLLETTCQELA